MLVTDVKFSRLVTARVSAPPPEVIANPSLTFRTATWKLLRLTYSPSLASISRV
jgi:hypothetical protein